MGKPFVKATTSLKKIKPWCSGATRHNTVKVTVKSQHFPNLHAVANKLVGRSAELLNKHYAIWESTDSTRIAIFSNKIF